MVWKCCELSSGFSVKFLINFVLKLQPRVALLANKLKRDNPKKFWNYINSKRKTESDIGDLIHVDDSGNTSVANTDELKAEFLCKALSVMFLLLKKIPLRVNYLMT